MEIERIHYLIEPGHSEQRICFTLNDGSFSRSALAELDTKELSQSKATLAGDCTKRVACDEKLVVPLKKRKQIHKELDLCDASTDQNLQKGEFNEENATPSQKLGQKNMCTSSSSEKGLGEIKIEFNLQSSVYVKADDSAKWTKLKCFESITVDGSNGATFFAGGPIQSSAFSMMPHDRKINQYIALAAGNAINNKHSCNDTKNVSGIIQFWNVGSLHERKRLNQSPSMELALYHDNGIITQMKWCPANCYDKRPSTCYLPRLGLLAASSTNSCVYIYSVPQPDSMPKSKPALPIYFTQPLMKLISLFDGPSFATRKAAATCIEWEKSGKRIVAGYANGAICVWMIKGSSFTSSIAMKNSEQPYVIQPYLFFQASGAIITSVSFAPFNNDRWLVVSSIDKVSRFYDLLDTSAPFHIVRQGFENNCLWSDAFCGVYSSPSVNSVGLISLSVKDCCVESNDKGAQKGLFDSSTNIAVSEKKNLHAIATMGGAVTVNVLNKMDKPLETSYLTYMILETEIMTLDVIDQKLKASECKISISGSIPSDVTSNKRDTFYTKMKQESSSSSSGFCSPNFGKTIVIETSQCFDDSKANLLNSPAKLSMSDFKELIDKKHHHFIKTSLNNQLCYSDEETNDEMINSFQPSEDLMHHLLMVKISNQSKSSPHLLPYNASDNYSYCDSKGAKHVSDKALNTSLTTSDTIIYPIVPCFSDTSHPDAQPESLNCEGNAVHQTTMHKRNGELGLKSELCTENNLNFSSVKSENFHPSENSSSKNWCVPISGRCNLNYEDENLKKSNNFNCDLNNNQLTSTHSDRKECDVSKNSSKEILKNEDNVPQNLDTKSNFVFEKDAILLSSCKNFDKPLCNVLESSNLNQPKTLSDMCSSIACNNFVICDTDDQQVSDRASIPSSAATDYSGDTIIYFPELHNCDKTADYFKMMEPGATFQSLYKSEKVNTFQDSLLSKMNENEEVVHGSEAKLTENGSSVREKCEHFLTKESLKYNSGYGTNSSSQGFNSSDEDRIFFPGDFLMSDFHLLHSEYLTEKSGEKNTRISKDPQEISYENLIANFGVIFKDNLDESANPLRHQENDICIEYNPLSVIKTIAWDPNEGCQSWLFIGGNSGIGRLVYVPDFAADKKKKPQRSKKRSVY